MGSASRAVPHPQLQKMPFEKPEAELKNESWMLLFSMVTVRSYCLGLPTLRRSD
jgi:hypothetical protein